MAEEKTVALKPADPVTEFQAFQNRLAAEEQLRAHKWSLPEVERLQAEAAADPEAAKALAALDPYISESNARGDFVLPHQMSRAKYAEHIGTTGPVYSIYDIDALLEMSGGKEYGRANDPLPREWSAELNRAQKEKRVMRGPIGDRGTPTPVHFAGESADSTERQNHLTWLNQCMTASVNVKEYLRETIDTVKQHKQNGVDQETILGFVINRATTAAQNIKGFERDLSAGKPAPFSPRQSAEFRQMDVLQAEVGGCTAWKFDD
jgi:hypothetical protein